MKKSLMWIISLISLIISGVMLPSLPQQIPAHFDIAGNIDRWGSRNEILLLPVVMIIISAVMNWLVNLQIKVQQKSHDDRNVKSAKQNEKVFAWAGVCIMVALCIMQGVMIINAFKTTAGMTEAVFDINKIMTIIIGGMMVFLGNIMPKAKMNSAFGLRTKWSMKNDEAWAKSNRFGGIAMAVGGIITVAAGCFLSGKACIVTALAVIIADSIISVWYSYKISESC